MSARSDPKLKRWYDDFNREWFRGRLPKDAVVRYDRLVDATGDLGWCLDRTIAISTRLRFSRRLARFTLLHEMSHMRLGTADHGPAFQRQMFRLAREGAFETLW